MKPLPLSDETAARVVRFQELDDFDTDTLVNLALDAYRLERGCATAEDDEQGRELTEGEWRERFRACREGQRYIEAVVYTALRSV